jgi:hypothetical protein
MRRVAVMRTRGDAKVDRELLGLAASLEDKARALEIAQKRPHTAFAMNLKMNGCAEPD